MQINIQERKNLLVETTTFGSAYWSIIFPKVIRDHPFGTYAKISKKLTFLTPLIRTRTCAYQGVKNVSFSENFAYIANG